MDKSITGPDKMRELADFAETPVAKALRDAADIIEALQKEIIACREEVLRNA